MTPISRRHNFRDSICVLGATFRAAHFCFDVAQRRDLFAHLGKAHAQVLSHRAPGSTRMTHALSRMNSTSAAKPSHCILHCARRCRLLGASVGAISSLCDAAVSGAHRARLLCARRGYLVGRSRSAALLAALLWSTSGPKVSAGACAGGSRLTPGGGQAIPRARLPLGVRCGPRHHRSPAAPPSRGVV